MTPTEVSGPACWQLLLMANSVTAWVAWRYVQRLATARRRARVFAWAIPAWLMVMAVAWWRCEWMIGLAIALGSLLFGALVWKILRMMSTTRNDT